MIFYKFFRPGENLNKALRYNEIYFSSNNQLNDPNDLKATYFLEDDSELWQQLLYLDMPYGEKQLSTFLKLDDGVLAIGLNEIFKNIKIDATASALNKLFTDQSERLNSLLKSQMKDLSEINNMWYSGEKDPLTAMSLTCAQGIKELLFSGLKTEVFSVSFTTKILEPMMWAHYADGFKGCAIIYYNKDGKLPLCKNIYGSLDNSNYGLFPLEDVTYQDGEKIIPLLECAVGTEDKIQKAFLTKNSFWRYEHEVRAFTFRKQRLLFAAVADKIKLPEYEERVFHVNPNSVLGVVFGPAFDESKKYKVEFTLREWKEKACEAPFLLFETRLRDDGTIKIIKGKQCEPSLTRINSKVLEGEVLENALKVLGIN